MDLRRIFTGGALAVLVLVAGCASVPSAERYVPPPQGATWTTQFSDSGSFGNGVSRGESRMATRMVDGRELLAFEGQQQTLLALPNGNWVGFMAKDGKMTVSFEPASTGWDWPLAAGKSWTREGKIKFHAQNREVTVQSKHVVEAVEEVKVPAGTFQTYRIRTTDTLGNDNIVWYAPEVGLFAKQTLVRSAQHPQGPGRRESELMVFKGPQKY